MGPYMPDPELEPSIPPCFLRITDEFRWVLRLFGRFFLVFRTPGRYCSEPMANLG
jgi:hypothetical protein